MDNFSLFDFLGEDSGFPAPLSKETAAKKKKENSKKNGTANKKGAALDHTSYHAPLKILGRNFKRVVGQNGETMTLQQVSKILFDSGLLEPCVEEIKYIKADESTFYMVSDLTASNENIGLAGDILTVIDGEEKIELVLEDIFPEYVQGEIPIRELIFYLERNYPKYRGCSLHYDAKAQVVIPLFVKISSNSELQLPVTVNLHGEEYQIGHKELENASYQDLCNYLFPSTDDFLKVSFSKRFDGCLVPIVNSKTKQTLMIDKAPLQKDANAKEPVLIKERYRLPATILLSQFGTEIQVSPEHFGGKEQIDKAELLQFLRFDFPIFRSTDRKIDVVYMASENMISVAALSGTKGSNSIQVEKLGLWGGSIYHRMKTMDDVISHNKDFYYGVYEKDGIAYKFNKLPIGIFCTASIPGRSTYIRYVRTLEKAPLHLLVNIIHYFKRDLSKEAVVQIRYDRTTKNFYIVYPMEYNSDRIHIDYQFHAIPYGHVVYATIHSHNTMPAYFSHVDDMDELGTGFYGVIGNLDGKISLAFRAGMDGCFTMISVDELFEKQEDSV